MNKTIDINCDLGEGLNNESALMPFISSCSIACGGHAGSRRIIRQVIDLAINHKVKIGAHPSFPDRANFGRIRLDLPFNELAQSIEEQLELILSVCEEKNVTLHHVKPHGALYNLVAVDRSHAELLVSIVRKRTPDATLYVPYHSVVYREALNQGVHVTVEAFADRNYNADYTLVARNKEHALITDPALLSRHLLSMVEDGQIHCVDGTVVPIEADTYCIHGDNAKAVALLQFITKNFANRNIQIAKQT